jgi:hypothetical protein
MIIEAEESIGIAATLIAFLGGAIIFTIADMIAKKRRWSRHPIRNWS